MHYVTNETPCDWVDNYGHLTWRPKYIFCCMSVPIGLPHQFVPCTLHTYTVCHTKVNAIWQKLRKYYMNS